MMKQKIRIGLVLGILTAVSLAALDRDVHAVGDGADAPAKLDVYRRAKGYTVLVTTDGRAATVTAKKAGKLVFTLDEKGSVTLPDGKEIAAQPVVRGKAHWGYFVPDTVSGIGENDLVDLTAAYAGSKAVLPDAVGAPLRVCGRKGPAYSWNQEESTILEQVSNTRLEFADFAYDVVGEGVADLVSGSAEVKDGTLFLKAVLREPVGCTMRVLLDTVPGAGYAGDGADYMLDNASLTRFTGSQPREWKWEAVGKVAFKRDGAAYAWEVPLKTIRPEETGRLRIRFQARTRGGTDEMPSDGKVLPILRPGNLAADPATTLVVSDSAPMYKTYPLTDGQTSRRIHWCFESWASGRVAPSKFVEFRFAQPTRVRQMVVWWEDLPKAAGVQVLNKDGRWTTVMSQKGSSGGGGASDWDSSATGAAIVDAAQEKLKKAEKTVFRFAPDTVTSGVRIAEPKQLWIREIEIY